jgi:hypothetical protein
MTLTALFCKKSGPVPDQKKPAVVLGYGAFTWAPVMNKL